MADSDDSQAGLPAQGGADMGASLVTRSGQQGTRSRLRTVASTGGPEGSGAHRGGGAAPGAATVVRSPEAAASRAVDATLVEDQRLRRPEVLDRLLQASPAGSPLRLVIEAFVDSFVAQLITALTITVILVMGLHAVAASARIAPAMTYVHFVACALYFARFRPHLSLLATGVLIGLAVLLFSIRVGTGDAQRPLLMFKPTLLFWVNVILTSGVATSFFNSHVDDLLARRVAVQQLQRDLRHKDEVAGKVNRSDQQVEDGFAMVKRAEKERQATQRRYSALMLQMQRLSENLDLQEIVRSVWQILRQGIGAKEVQVWAVSDGVLNLVAAFKRRDLGVTDGDPSTSYEQANSDFDEKVAEGAFPVTTVPVGKDSANLFAWVIRERKRFMVDDEKRPGMFDPITRKLRESNPVPVAYCFPLFDRKNNEIKGLINVGEGPGGELGEEGTIILRTTADLSAMAISHWQTLETVKGAALLLKKKFEKYVSPGIVEQIIAHPESLKPRRQKVTVMFVDLRGFTNISEANTPEEVVRLLRDFFNQLTPLIFEWGGILDKYIGDEIMAIWGAPISDPLAARRAVASAWSMMEAFAGVKERWTGRLGRSVDIGIALNTGEAVIGEIGSDANVNYTAIGDAVNTAARLEGCTGPGKVYITKSTYEEVSDMVGGEWQPPMRVQGKALALEMFDIQKISLSKEVIERGPPGQSTSAAPAARMEDSRELARRLMGGAGRTDGASSIMNRADVAPDEKTINQTAGATAIRRREGQGTPQ